jgi:hypothetical protein
MDVLTRFRSGRLVAAVLVSACIVATACLSFPRTRSEPSFPHRVHVVDNQLACTFCHGSVRVSDDPSLPPPELCATCHAQFDGDKPRERRLAAFFDEGGRYRRVAVSGRTEDVLFSHRAHAETERFDCTVCHADVATQDSVPLEPLMVKAQCMDCHEQRGLGTACADCHRSIDRTWLPPTHGPQWLRLHGSRVQGAHAHTTDRASVDRCSLCHVDGMSCLSCHQQMAPRDHDQSFRLRTHGLMASLDRTRCFVCHTRDSCQQCHENTRPLSHRGGFGSPLQRHCTNCHLPLAETGCAVCHEDAVGHSLAPGLPPGHVPSMNCRACHGNGVPLRHPDGGHVCTACHR